MVFPHSAIRSFGSVIRRNFSHQDWPQVKELLEDRRRTHLNTDGLQEARLMQKI